MTRVDLTPAYLIHRRAFKDTSLLLDFFTFEHGKIRLVGRGLRKSKTNIQMFQRLNISFVGKGDLKTLSDWEVDDQPRNLSGEVLILGLYVNELIDRLLHEKDPHYELFELYRRFVNQVSSLEKNAQLWLLRLFENNLLTELGYEIDLSVDVDGDDIGDDFFYEYQMQSGFVKSTKGKISGHLLKQLSTDSLDEIPNSSQLRVCRDLNRARLKLLLGDKPLKSRSLFFRS